MHLRSFLAAFVTGKPLPERPRDVSAEWEELVGLGARRRLRERADTFGRLEPYLPTLPQHRAGVHAPGPAATTADVPRAAGTQPCRRSAGPARRDPLAAVR